MAAGFQVRVLEFNWIKPELLISFVRVAFCVKLRVLVAFVKRRLAVKAELTVTVFPATVRMAARVPVPKLAGISGPAVISVAPL